MSKTFTPGPWLDYQTLEWIHKPQDLLASTENALLIAAAPDMYEALECYADLKHFNECNFATKVEIVGKWLDRINELLPDKSSEHSAIANWTHYAFTLLPGKLRAMAIAKARGIGQTAPADRGEAT